MGQEGCRMSTLFGVMPASHQPFAQPLCAQTSRSNSAYAVESTSTSAEFFPGRPGGSPCVETQILDDSLILNVVQLSPRAQEAADVVKRLAELREGWDSYGSAPVGKAAVSSALHLLCAFDIYGFPTPQVFPVSGGALQLEWFANGRRLEVAAYADGISEFLAIRDGDYDQANEGIIDPRDLSRVNELVRWLNA